MTNNPFYSAISKNEAEILAQWETEHNQSIRSDLIRGSELKQQLREFFEIFKAAIATGHFKDVHTTEWSRAKEFLSSLSHSRGLKGFTPTETALFVFSLKKSFTNVIRKELGENISNTGQMWEVTDLLDSLGLFTTEIYQKAREEVINRQQQDMLELSTPVVELAEGIIALPMIGTLDSGRTQIVMETLLQRIVETEAEIAIIDITGVPTVDTLVAQHLIKTVTAARLMGAECIISGIRPQIAATIVHLGVDLGSVITKSSLASALSIALKKTGHSVIKNTHAAKA